MTRTRWGLLVFGALVLAGLLAVAFIPKPTATLIDQWGQGIANSKMFTTQKDTWTVEWQFSCPGELYVTVWGGGDVEHQTGRLAGKITEYSAGSYYVRVNSACPWHVKVRG